MRFPQAFGGGSGVEGDRTSLPEGPHCLWGAAPRRCTLFFLSSSLLSSLSFSPPFFLPLPCYSFLFLLSFIRLSDHLFVLLFSCSLIHPVVRSFIHSVTCLFFCSFIYLFNRLTSHPSIHVFSLQFGHHLFIHSVI